MPRPQTPSRQSTSGPADRVPCPHCRQPQDFRAHMSGGNWGNTLETGMVCSCDHCGKHYTVAGVRPVVMVTLRQHNR